MTKPKNIEWVYIYPNGDFPPIKTPVLISFNAGNHINPKRATIEGYFGNPFIDFPNMKLEGKDKNCFENNSFYDTEGNLILLAYAWAYKPKSMLGGR